ncbi:STAS domain-containing protein [Actinoplanes sp. NPDC051411]|uniref:STAS domain-containing protein n=1 Tax=Actinoplanes sp. NPDC051411 TaxID=3155522 RepID=UPI003436CC51
MDQPDDSVVVVVRGDLDVDSAPVLTTALDQVLAVPLPRVVVDLSGIGFCDSIGLSAFVVGHHRAAALGGWVRLAAPSEFLVRLLDRVGLTPAVPVYREVADALVDRGAY